MTVSPPFPSQADVVPRTAQDPDAWLDRFAPDELLDICCPAIAIARGPSLVRREPVGALKLWHAERANRRREAAGDPLTLAACREAAGIDAARQGLTIAAADHFAAAERIIQEAAERKLGEKSKLNTRALLNARARVTIARDIVPLVTAEPSHRRPLRQTQPRRAAWERHLTRAFLGSA
jgi:hypothetical protein